MNQIGQLATTIWDNEFGHENSELEREIAIEGISGQLEANSLGQMNLMIYTSFGMVSGDVDPELKNEENAILTEIYLRDWYKKQSRNILRGIGVSSYNSSSTSDESSSLGSSALVSLADDWTVIKEGDTTIQRNRAVSTKVGSSIFSNVSNDAARVFRQLSEESAAKLTELTNKYNLYKAEPIQVGSDSV